MDSIVITNSFSNKCKPTNESDVQQSVLSLAITYNILPIRGRVSNINGTDRVFFATIDNNDSKYIDIYGYFTTTSTTIDEHNWSIERFFNLFISTKNTPLELFLYSSDYIKMIKCNTHFLKQKVSINIETFKNSFIPSLTSENIQRKKGYIFTLNNLILNKLPRNSQDTITKQNLFNSLNNEYINQKKFINEIKHFQNNLLELEHLKDKKAYEDYLSDTIHISDTDYDCERIKEIYDAAKCGERFVYHKTRKDAKIEKNPFARFVDKLSSKEYKHYSYPYLNERWQLDPDFIRKPYKLYQKSLEEKQLKSTLIFDNNLSSEGLRNPIDNTLLKIYCENLNLNTANTRYAPDGKGLLYGADNILHLNLIEFKVSYISTLSQTGKIEQERREENWLEQIQNNIGVYSPDIYMEYIKNENLRFKNKNNVDVDVTIDMLEKRKVDSICKDTEIFTQYILNTSDNIIKDIFAGDKNNIKNIKLKIKNDLMQSQMHYTFIINEDVQMSNYFLETACSIIRAYGCIPHIFKIYRYYLYSLRADEGEIKYILKEITPADF